MTFREYQSGVTLRKLKREHIIKWVMDNVEKEGQP